MDPSKKRKSTDQTMESSKKPKLEKNVKNVKLVDGAAIASKLSPPLLETMRNISGPYLHKNGTTTGHCIICKEHLDLTWHGWKRHLLKHTSELEFYCFECDSQLPQKSPHGNCSIESIIDIFDAKENHALEGFICKLCDFMRINDSQLVAHLNEKHENAGTFFDTVERLTLLPSMYAEPHIIPNNYKFAPQDKQYQCGAGQCKFHGRTSAEFVEHFTKAHSIVKTFFCPHCKKMINRMDQPTVPIENVLHHIGLHGAEVFQCFCCDFTTASEQEVKAHTLNVHLDMPVKYWRNERTENCMKQADLIEIIFDCDICKERIASVQAAIDHFKTTHLDYEINLRATKQMKTTTRDAKVLWLNHGYFQLYYRQVFTCGVCDDVFPDMHQWLEHFLDTHPAQPLAVKRDFKWVRKFPKMNDSNFDKDMLYFCAFCEDQNGWKNMCSSTIEGIYDHWTKFHMRADLKPFRFCVAELIACHHCGVMSTFHELEEHFREKHPRKPFTPVKIAGKHTQCALCDYTGDNFIEHFQCEHAFASEAKVFSPLRIGERTLQELQKVFVHRKLKCDYCDMVFETFDEFHEHHFSAHPKKTRSARAFTDRDSVKLIGDCCRTQVDPSTFFDHLAHFRHTLQCEMCPFVTANAFTYVSHRVEVHNEPGRISLLYRNFLRRWYWRSELVFGNGLVVNRFNTAGTKYDYTAKFDGFVDRLIAEKRTEYTTDRGKTHCIDYYD